MEPEIPLLDQYVIEQADQDEPRICFLPTASGDAEDYIQTFYASFSRFRCRPTHLSLFRPPTKDIEAFVLENSIIYVGGGNTRSMLALWAEWGLDTVLRKAWQQGIVLAGMSSGSVCWFEEALSDFVPGEFNRLQCLGFLPGSNCPHYDSEPSRRPLYQSMILRGELAPGIATDDGVGLHYVGTELLKTVSSRPDAKAYRVSKNVVSAEREIVPVYLGNNSQK
jgi:peptidase E